MSARITVIGNVASIPTRRQTAAGRSVTSFRIGSTERRLDKETGQWVDGNRFFVGVACWGALADNVAESVRIGMPLIVTGRISQRTWTDDQQQTRFYYEIQADTVAPDLARGTATFSRVSRSLGPSVSLDDDGQPAYGRSDVEFDIVDNHDRTRRPADLVDEPAGRDPELVGASG